MNKNYKEYGGLHNKMRKYEADIRQNEEHCLIGQLDQQDYRDGKVIHTKTKSLIHCICITECRESHACPSYLKLQESIFLCIP